eukprot:6204387-Pleurochrysis_carterae.AAC.1
MHAVQSGTPTWIAAKAKAEKDAKLEASKKAKAATQLEQKKKKAKQHAPAPAPAAPQPASYPIPPPGVNGVTTNTHPIDLDGPPQPASRIDAIRVRLAELKRQAEEEKALLEQLVAEEHAASERAAHVDELRRRLMEGKKHEVKPALHDAVPLSFLPPQAPLPTTLLPAPAVSDGNMPAAPLATHHAAWPQHVQRHRMPPTPDAERALMKTIRVLQAQRAEDGVAGLGGQLAGLQFELETMRRDRKRRYEE